MTSPLTLSARELRSTIATYADLLRSHKDVINRLNVYPVPDGDTGTNMTLTIESVAAELGPLADDAEMSEVCKAIAHGSLMGARGNSGVILSQMLRGLVAKFPVEWRRFGRSAWPTPSRTPTSWRVRPSCASSKARCCRSRAPRPKARARTARP